MRPWLVVRCTEGRLTVRVELRFHPGAMPGGREDEHRVRLKLDAGAPVTEEWTLLATEERRWAPDPVAQIARLTKSRYLFFEFSPLRGAPMVATFPVAGLERYTPRLFDRCPARS